MKKLNLIWILGLILIGSVFAFDNLLSQNEFSDGTQNFTTQLNITKFIELPTNSTIISANISVRGNVNSYSKHVGEEIFYSAGWTGPALGGYGSGYSGPPIDGFDWVTDDDEFTGDSSFFPAYPTVYVLENFSMPTEFHNNMNCNITIFKDVYYNVSLLPQVCEKNKIQLKHESYLNAGDQYVKFYCMNDTGWHEYSNDSRTNVINEVWLGCYSLYPEDVVIYVNETVVFNHTGNLTGTNSSVSLNTVVIDNWLTKNSTVPINFTMKNFGMLEVFDLSINFEDLWECNETAGEVVAYNFSLKDEDTFASITGNISVDLTYLDNVLAFNRSNVNHIALCIGGSQNYTISGEIIGDVAFTNKYFLIEAVFDPVINEIDFYNFGIDSGQSTLDLTVRKPNYDVYSGVIIKLERYYPELHSWLEIQADKTGEFGRGVFHVYEEDTEYRLNLYLNLSLLKQTGTIKFICTSGLCTVTTTTSDEALVYYSITPSITFNNNTDILTVTWNDPSGETSDINVKVDLVTSYNTINICDQTVSATGGSIECNTSGYTGIAKVTLLKNGQLKYDNALDLLNDGIDKYIPSADAAFWNFGIGLTISMFGVTGSAVAVVIMAVVSVFVMYIIGMTTFITPIFVGLFTFIGIVVAYIMKKS